MRIPLAKLTRPKSLDDMVGQQHLVGEKGIIRKILDNNQDIPNMILYGPSGTGKTTLSNIIANKTNKKIYFLNATTASKKDIEEVISDINKIDSQNGILLYLDEIQYFSKKQQQVLLQFIEEGDITLIASTTENPYFYIYNAFISRSVILEFYPVSNKDILKSLRNSVSIFEEYYSSKVNFEEGILEYISSRSGGDVRKAINYLEVMLKMADIYQGEYSLTLESCKALMISPIKYDKDGDEHYDLLSCLQKSIRGSDPDASIFYLAKLLEAKDIISITRRLLVIASEDISLAYPLSSVIVKSLVDSALQLGLPEARIPLSEATIFLATCPKSNSSIVALEKATNDIHNGLGLIIPQHIRDGHYQGAKDLNRSINYLYPHDYENNYVEQQYLPSDLVNRKYYEYGNNKIENSCKQYWESIKLNKKK